MFTWLKPITETAPERAPAILKLNSLQAEFERVATDSGKRKFFQSWFDDNRATQVEYAGYAQATAAAAATLLTKKDKTPAVTALTGIKGTFDNKSAAFTAASRRFFSSWFGKDEQEAKRFQGYARKVDEVLKLL